MAPFPDTVTDKFFINYSNAIASHTLLIRTVPDVDTTVFFVIVDQFLTLVSGLTSRFTLDSIDYSAAGDAFSQPLFAPILGNEYGDAIFPATPETNPRAVGFLGRDSVGRRGRLFMFGALANDNNYRITTAESQVVADVVSFLADRNSTFVTITGNKCVFNAYANLKPNDYWVGRSRG